MRYHAGVSSGFFAMFVTMFVAIFVTMLATTCAANTPWQRHVIDDSSRGADGIRLADFNRDGKLDFVTGWEEGSITRVYLQPDSSRIRERWPAVTVGKTTSVEDAVAVDLDADGQLDVVSSTEGRTRTLFVHWAPKDATQLLNEDAWQTQVLPASVQAQTWMFCLPLQVDGQFGVDLVTGSKGPNAAVGWWEAPAQPRELQAWKYHRLIDAGWIMSLIAHDMDDDGDLDVLLTDRKGARRGAKWLEMPEPAKTASASAWIEHSIHGADRELLFCAQGDVNHDGALDLLIPTWNGTLDLLLRRPGPGVPSWRTRSIPYPYQYQRGKSVAVGDFDRDGRIDVVATLRSVPPDHPAVILWRHDGDPLRGRWTATDIGGPDGSKFDLIEAIDIDADGDLDLLTCEEVANLGIFWYENPTFTAARP